MSTEFLELNAQVKGKTIDLQKDRQAVRSYFLNHVNRNLYSAISLKEKLQYLVDEGYYEDNFINKYKFGFVKKLRKHLENKHHRFCGLVPALKFYRSYALKTWDGKTYLERYEDRILAVALVLGAGDETRAWELAEEMISQRFQPATPTFTNAGRKNAGRFISCFLINVGDSLNDIYKMAHAAAKLSQAGGGVGLNFTDVRAEGDPVQGRPGLAASIIQPIRQFDVLFPYVNQGGTRPGAGVAYLHAHHLDIQAFLNSKRENADEGSRLKNLSMGVIIPDITIELARNDENMYLFSPYDASKFYGKPFSEIDITAEYRAMVENPAIRKRHIKARDFFTQLAEVQMNSGYPYITWIDNVNKVNPINGVIKQSNLCYTGDTRVLTSSGYRTAFDLYKDGGELEIISDNRAVGEALGTFSSSSTAMHKTAEQADVFELKTKQGYKIKATEWHKFYVNRAGQKIKIALNEIRVGDKLYIQSGQGSYGSFHDTDLAYLAGVLAADGTYAQFRNGETLRLDLYGAKRQWKDKIEDAAARVIQRYGSDIHHSSYPEPKFVQSESADRISMVSAPLAKVFADYGLNSKTKTNMPDFIWSSDKATQGAYLLGLYQMDGSLSVSKKFKTASIEIGSVNSKFLQDLQLLFLNAGVVGRIYDGKKAGFYKMPDGNGGLQDYWCQASQRYFIQNRQSREALISFVQLKPEDMLKYEEYKSWVSPIRISGPKQNFMALVESIQHVGQEDVYDVTVPGHHSQLINGILTGNCNEIYQVQESSVLNDKLEYITLGKDISCNLGSLNIKATMESPDFGKTVEVAIGALTEVSDTFEMQSVPTVDSGNRRSHAIGLGQMNLHGYLASQHIHYGSPEALAFIDTYAMMVTYHAIRTSMLIAKERNETFDGFENSQYADGSYFDKYINVDQLGPHYSVRHLFKKHTVPWIENWQELRKNVMQYGMYNQNLQAIPPTGSISYVNNSTSSIAPIAAKVETREEGKLGRVNYPAPGITPETFEYFTDAYETGNKAIIDTAAAFQKHVDQGISMNVFFKDTDTTEDVNRIQAYAQFKGLKGIYYTRVKKTILEGTDIDYAECEACAV